MILRFPSAQNPDTGTLVSRAQFEADCVARWGPLGVPEDRVRALLHAAVAWVQGALLLRPDARRPTARDLLGIDEDDAATERCAAEIIQLVTAATLRELPFLGMSRVRRANALFQRTYGGGGGGGPPRRRHVRFALPLGGGGGTQVGQDVEDRHGLAGRPVAGVQADGHRLHGPMRRWRRPIDFSVETLA